ncbi:MAG: hypothetical protein H6960_00220 [Chromatiaceae bacterium]|nr:hypothetical protein [Chromatiaceae bacterium]
MNRSAVASSIATSPSSMTILLISKESSHDLVPLNAGEIHLQRGRRR